MPEDNSTLGEQVLREIDRREYCVHLTYEERAEIRKIINPDNFQNYLAKFKNKTDTVPNSKTKTISEYADALIAAKNSDETPAKTVGLAFGDLFLLGIPRFLSFLHRIFTKLLSRNP